MAVPQVPRIWWSLCTNISFPCAWSYIYACCYTFHTTHILSTYIKCAPDDAFSSKHLIASNLSCHLDGHQSSFHHSHFQDTGKTWSLGLVGSMSMKIRVLLLIHDIWCWGTILRFILAGPHSIWWCRQPEGEVIVGKNEAGMRCESMPRGMMAGFDMPHGAWHIMTNHVQQHPFDDNNDNDHFPYWCHHI